MPVYSLATYDEGKVNMNICTYVTAISMKPKQFAIAVYYNTRSLENLNKEKKAVLQILNKKNIQLIKPLGRTSGFKRDKDRYLDDKKAITSWNNYKVLKEANAYIELEVMDRQNTQGDHELFWFQARRFKTVHEDGVLMFQDLVEAGIIL